MICINIFDLDCLCNLTGTGGDESCDIAGQCSCVTGFSGLKCDECPVGYSGADCTECSLAYYSIGSTCTGI